MNLLHFMEYSIAFTTIFVSIFITLIFLLNEKSMKVPKVPRILPKVSILVPAYNEEEFIAATIESLLALDYPKSKREIIVLNDGSKDKTAEIVKQFGNLVTLVNKTNSGKADSLNQGIKMAKGEIIVTMDGDSTTEPGTLKSMVGYFEDKRVGAVATNVFVRNTPNFLSRVQKIEYFFAIFARRILEFIDCVTVTPGPFSLFRKSALKKVGGFDPESLVEDQEIALNLQMHGYAIRTAPDAKVYSDVPLSFRALMAQRVRWQRGGFYNAMKYRCIVGIKNGDLGILMMPYTIFGYAALTLVPFLIIWSLFAGSAYNITLGWEGLRLSFGTIHILSAIMVFFTFIWLYFGMRDFFVGEKPDIISLLVFILVYPMLLTIFWLFAAYKELTKQTKQWNV